MSALSTRSKLSNEINAGSMADIAFLLLIFFLVTTTIFEDKGLLVKLPPLEEDKELIHTGSSQVLSVLVNGQNELLVDGKEAELVDLRARVKTFISATSTAQHAQKVIISLQNDRATAYHAYIAVYNELLGAYQDLWDEAANVAFDKPYRQCTKAERKRLHKRYPLTISEAEPTDYAESRALPQAIH